MPATCSICYEPFTSPVSLPCGHVFCRECLRRAVEAVKSRTVQHSCPSCRASYSILTLDPALIPPYLRPHILPPIRKVFIDEPAAASTSTSTSVASATAPPAPAPAGPSAELARITAEAATLREHCATWRRRAETHAAANASLLAFARAAKDCALRLRAERDAERSQYCLLKRKLAELMPDSPSPSDSSPFTVSDPTRLSSTASPQRKHAGPPPRTGLPVFLMQCKPPEQFYDNPTDMHCAHFGPPMKRRRADPAPTLDSESVAGASAVSEPPTATSLSERSLPMFGGLDV
ncbi:hypothetical protein DFH06DRAFT_1038564 [Mycena polygramma]|nr:hypothetical protein DFH06DRAFT_1038564 [Mycena polygramma]